MRVIATLSTIPSRIGRIRPTIESLLKQTCPVEKVEVNVPHWCVRTAEPYVVPDWLMAMDNVEVHRTEDYGAITKVAMTLIRHDKEDVFIWSVDDDFVYDRKHLEEMMKGIDRKSILCLSGARWTSQGFGACNYGRVDIVEGFFGILYPPNCIKEDFLPYVEKTSANWDARKSDDIILSNYFALHNVPMIKLPTHLRSHGYEQTYGNEADSLKKQDDGHYVRYKRVLEWLKSEKICGWNVNIVASAPRPRPSHPVPRYVFYPETPRIPVLPTAPSYFAYALKGKKKL